MTINQDANLPPVDESVFALSLEAMSRLKVVSSLSPEAVIADSAAPYGRYNRAPGPERESGFTVVVVERGRTTGEREREEWYRPQARSSGRL